MINVEIFLADVIASSLKLKEKFTNPKLKKEKALEAALKRKALQEKEKNKRVLEKQIKTANKDFKDSSIKIEKGVFLDLQ